MIKHVIGLLGHSQFIAKHRTLVMFGSTKRVGVPYHLLPTKAHKMYRWYQREVWKNRAIASELVIEKGKHENTRQKLIKARKEISQLKRARKS